MVGKQLLQARADLERDGFEVEESRVRSEAPFDQVVDQDPNPREEADEGSTVVLEVSGGPGHGARADGARAAAAGGDPGAGEARPQGDRRPAAVGERSRRASRSARSRAPASRSSAASGCSCSSARGPSRSQVPDVIGLSRDSAEDRLTRRGPRVRGRGARVRGAGGRGDLPEPRRPGPRSTAATTVTITVSTGIAGGRACRTWSASSAGDAARQLRAAGLRAGAARDRRDRRRARTAVVSISARPAGTDARGGAARW